ncbi:MAG TPA: hypothetical protein VEC56_02480 [Candidatus Krumholzibacteria bacterium]|nr:hypothetical protein [Candidatus Krumholzibacteria bacterium]
MSKAARHTYALAVVLSLSGFVACSDDSTAPPPDDGPTRTYRMGFSGIPPRPDLPTAIAAIDMWSLRADAAIMSFELPWDSLLAGVPVETLVIREQESLANYYRFKGHELWIYLDPANGLNRGGEADALVRNGRSITEPAIQQMFRRYAVVVDSIVRPEHLGLTLETNLIRGASPDSLYQAIRQVANDAAADVRAIDATVKLSVSVQVDFAWGRFGGPYQGVDQDFVDFPFIEELGLSSYPYLARFAQPEEIPIDYYTRLIEGRTIPVMVTEGGWSSATIDTIVSSEDEQRRYIERQARLLDEANAIAVFQLTFTDLDLASFPPQPPNSILYLFVTCGLVDADLNPKAALTAWDAIFARPLGS